MRLVFAGTPEVAVPTLRALLGAERHEVAAVVTRPDAPAGRGRARKRSPVALLAEEAGVEVLTPQRAGEEEFTDRLREIAPDCCPVVAYGNLLAQRTLEIPRHGWINLHFSLLPAWRGAAPVPAAIQHGDEVTGATTFRLVPEMDAGPVLGTVTEPVARADTSGELLARLAASGAQLMLHTLDAIAEGSARPQPQPAEGVSYAPKLTAAQSQVDWQRPGFAVDRLIRAVTPAPGAWTSFRGERLKLGPTRPVEDRQLPVGELLLERDRVLVGTGSWAVVLGQVQPAGKTWMPATDWVRGARVESGEQLG